MDSGSRKRLRRFKDNDSYDNQDQQSSGTNIDDRKFDIPFPKNLEARFATAIFELGLKNSSPKVLMPLMPADTNLSTEHIKSHLQKYRIHRQRSKDEFLRFYEEYIKESYQNWENCKGWKKNNQNDLLPVPIPASTSMYNFNTDNNFHNNIQHMDNLNTTTMYQDNLQHNNNNYSQSIDNIDQQQTTENNNNIAEYHNNIDMNNTNHILPTGNILQTTDTITNNNDQYTSFNHYNNHNNNISSSNTDHGNNQNTTHTGYSTTDIDNTNSASSGYVKELYRETEILLNNLQTLCQEVVHREDILKDQINTHNV